MDNSDAGSGWPNKPFVSCCLQLSVDYIADKTAAEERIRMYARFKVYAHISVDLVRPVKCDNGKCFLRHQYLSLPLVMNQSTTPHLTRAFGTKTKMTEQSVWFVCVCVCVENTAKCCDNTRHCQSQTVYAYDKQTLLQSD